MTSRTTREILILLGLCALLLIPAVVFRNFTGMEFRTALFVREILRDGPSLIPRLDGTPYFDYPPLYFLAAALCSRLLGALTPLSIAMPSMLAAAATVLLVFFMAERERPGTGLAAGAALVLTPLFLFWASLGSVDALLVFFTTLALAGCRGAVLSGGRPAFAAACLGLAGGALTKGPIAVAVPLFAASAWLLASRRPRACASLLLKLGLFLAAFAAVCAAAMLLLEGGDPLERLIGAQILDRVGDEANKSRLYYLGVFFGGFAPWSLLALGRLFRRGDREYRDFDIFCLSWFLSTFLLFTLASSKHSRYLLPAAPPVAILAAAWWDDLGRPGAPAWLAVAAAWTRRVCLCLLAAAGLFAAIGPLLRPAASPLLWAVIPVVCLLPIAVPALRREGARGSFALFAWVLVGGFLLYAQFDTPTMKAKEEARPFVREVERRAEGRRVVFHGISGDGDGLKFRYWRRGTGPLAFAESPSDLRLSLAEETPAVLVVAARRRESVEGEFGPRLRLLFEGRLGKRSCAVYEVAGPPAPTAPVAPQ